MSSIPIIVVAVLVVSGCIDQASVSQLATTSADVANTLAKVYDLLAQEKGEALATRLARTGLDPDPRAPRISQPELDDYDAIIGNLAHRGEMASALAGVYQALGALALANTSKDLATAGHTLANDLTKLLSLGAGNPLDILGSLADAVGRWKADQDLAQAIRDAAPAAGLVSDFFTKEENVYTSIASDRRDALRDLALPLVSHNIINPDAVLRVLSDMYGVSLGTPTCPAPGASIDCVKAAAELLKFRAERVNFVSMRAIASMAKTLASLKESYTITAASHTPPIRIVQQYLDETKAYLNEAIALRTSSTSH